MAGLQIFPSRALIPGWAKVALPALAVVLAIWAVMDRLDQLTAWWPFSDESKLKRAETKIEDLEVQLATARLDAVWRNAEAEGNADQLRRAEVVHTQVIEIRTATAAAETEARNIPDAEAPLALGRAGLLRGHDDRLCDQAAGLPDCPVAAPPGDPGAGAEAVPPAGAAGEPDAG